MADDTDHITLVESLSKGHQERLVKALDKAERRIVDILADAPTKDGQLFDLEWAVNSRQAIKEALDEEYLASVDSVIREYSAVADSAAEMIGKYADVTKVDADVVKQLQKLTFQGFEDVGLETLDIVQKQVYEAALTGQTFAQSVDNVRKAVGADASRYAKQQVTDSLMQFNSNINVAIGKKAGATHWKYSGSLVEDSRSHCRKHEGKIYTEEEINEIWSGSWQGKAEGNPFIVRGGYNCGHQWRPVFDVPAEQRADAKPTPFQTSSDLDFKDKQARVKIDKVMSKVTVKQLAVQKKVRQPTTIRESVVDPNNEAYYERSIGLIKADPEIRGGSIMRHEYGHHIDYELEYRKSGLKYTSISQNDRGFTKAFEADRKHSKLIKGMEKDDSIKAIRKELYEMDITSRGGYTYSKEVIINDELGNFSDIIDAMTFGYMQDRYGGYGHGRGYFKQKSMRYKECFANLYALRGTPYWDSHVKKYCPNMAKRFDELIDEVLD